MKRKNRFTARHTINEKTTNKSAIRKRKIETKRQQKQMKAENREKKKLCEIEEERMTKKRETTVRRRKTSTGTCRKKEGIKNGYTEGR